MIHVVCRSSNTHRMHPILPHNPPAQSLHSSRITCHNSKSRYQYGCRSKLGKVNSAHAPRELALCTGPSCKHLCLLFAAQI
jgi:hypothetical protein